ncbi:MAG: aminoacyl-tRNA hydrolase [Thermoleophilia bacterium]
MHLIAALGNPGPEHEHQRHNVGFMVGEELRRRAGWGPLRTKFNGLFGDGLMEGRRTALLLPMSYMNRSGEPVAKAARFYRVPVEHLLVIHDEVELPFGEVRLKEGGGLGGHNGLRSIEAALGSRDFWRVRVGVGRPEEGGRSLANYLLSPFTEPPDEVRSLVAAAAEAAQEWLREREEESK